MNFYYYHLVGSLVLTGLTTIVLGLFVLVRKKNDFLGLIFFLWCCSIAWWSLLEVVIITRDSPESALFWGRVTQAGDIFLPTFFVHFVLTLLKRKPSRFTLGILYLVSSSFAVLCFTPLVISSAGPRQTVSFFLNPGPLYPPMLGFFLCSVLYGQFQLFSAYKAASGHNMAKLGYLFWSSVAGYVGGCMNFLLVYEIEIPVLYSFGTYAVPLFVAATSHAIIQYRLMDISVAMEKGLNYLLLSIIVLVPFYAVLLVAQETYFAMISYPFSLVVTLLLALMLIGAFKIKGGAQVAIARIFFRERYDTYETLSKFSKALASILDLKTLVEEIVRTLVTVLGVETATLYLFDKERRVYTSVSTYGPSPESGDIAHLTANDKLPRHLAASQTILVREEVEHFSGTKDMRALLDALRRVKADLCIPFVNKNTLIGFCILGPRRERQMYADQDLSLLTMLAQAAAIALDNAVLYEELKRSRSLVRRTDRLRSLETIAGGFAHEVRNPLTSIKTFIQLTPERKDDPEFIGHFSTVVAEDVARIERLIQEILDYARYMQPQFQEEDVNVILESCLYFVRIKADSKEVCLKKDLASDLPAVLLDRQQIKQVLLNLFINAIEAMGDHGGQLLVRTHRLSKAPGDTWVQIEVTDTGCGIPPADLEHIFDPFYTTKHESQEREGTGLGLTIVHQIVHEHGGLIEVKSEPGRGTTFLVNLPAVPARVLEAPLETRGV
ncbi:MAG: GAF domain-containing protein [Nitrospirae bacterium]|nr:MAG: GAF domain-containing protein [Nitrospirota bacterium]